MTDTPFCSLDPESLAARMGAWAHLAPAVISRRRTATGAEVRYRLEPALAERLVELMRAEAACCPDLTFEATVTLAVDAPEAMRAAVVELTGSD